jgi:hypothetical protein
MRTSYRLMHLADRTVSPAAQAFMDVLLAVEAELMAREAEVAPARGAAGRYTGTARAHVRRGVGDPAPHERKQGTLP